MNELIVTLVLVILLLLYVLTHRIDWFGLLEWKNKYEDGYEYPKKWVNDDSGINQQAVLDCDGGSFSVINDGYGNKNAPYEVWEPQEDDVEGWLTKEEVAAKVRKYY